MNATTLDANRWTANEPEPMPVTAGVLTVFVHIAFAAMLLLNMSWQQRIAPYSPVKLWDSMPTTIQKSAKRSKPKPTPPPPEAVSEPTAKAAIPKTEPTPPSPAMPDVLPPPTAALPPPPGSTNARKTRSAGN